MATHPVYHKPNLTCGVCHSTLLLPLRKDEQQRLIADGKPVLAECGICAVAIEVPPEMLDHGPPHHLDTTVARPWKPKA